MVVSVLLPFQGRASLVVQGETLADTYEAEVNAGTPAPEWEKYMTRATGPGVVGFITGFAVIGFLRLRDRRRAAGAGLLAAILLVFPAAAGACINVEESTLEGTYEAESAGEGWFTGTVRNAMRASAFDDPHLEPNPKAYPVPPPPGVLECDEAARKILRGDAQSALVLLKEVEARHPGLYMTAANMGTAYELTGDNENAHLWIATGIRRNPGSHMGAEWLHLRILEAKMALQKDPDWLLKNSITGLKPGHTPHHTIQGEKDDQEVLVSIRSQATVRALFIKPRDPVMAFLLKEAAVFAVEREPSMVFGILDLAETYGLPGTEGTTLRAIAQGKLQLALMEARSLRDRENPGPWYIRHFQWIVGALGGMAGCLTAIFVISRKG